MRASVAGYYDFQVWVVLCEKYVSIFFIFFQMPPGIALSNPRACLSLIVHLGARANHSCFV